MTIDSGPATGVDFDLHGLEFWRRCAQHQFSLTHCRTCGRFAFPPKDICPSCWEDDTMRPGAVAIVGVGWAGFSRDSGTALETLAARAVRAAITDAGLTKGDIDGLTSSYLPDEIWPLAVHEVLEFPLLRWWAFNY